MILQELFSQTLYLRPNLNEARLLPSPIVLFSYFAKVSCDTCCWRQLLIYTFSIIFSSWGWGALLAHFPVFYYEQDMQGGDGTLPFYVFVFKRIDSIKLKSPFYFPVQVFSYSFLFILFQAPISTYKRFPFHYFLFNLFFLPASCLCFNTLMPFKQFF